MTAERRTRTSLLVLSLFAAAIASLMWAWASVQTSSANFGDQETVDGNHLGTGTVDIALGDGTVKFDVASMAAGDIESGQLELTNAGTFPLRYSVTASTGGGPLAGVVEVSVWLRTSATCADRVPPTGTWVRPDGLAGSPGAPSARALAPGESDVLCMLGRLPLSAPSSVQGQQLDLNVLVTAEHDLEAS